jgi:hypothetical protein
MKYITKHKNGSYQVMVYIKRKPIYLGLYKDINDAIKVRDKFLEKNNSLIKQYNSYYFNNKEMYKEIVISKAIGKLSNILFNNLLEIVKGVSKKFKYDDEDDRYDCEAYAIEMIIKNWYHFDEEKYDNVFAYFTEIIKRGFANQYNKLNKTRINCVTINELNI